MEVTRPLLLMLFYLVKWPITLKKSAGSVLDFELGKKNRALFLLKALDFYYFDDTIFSMTQLLSHTFAHLTGSSSRLKAKLLSNKNTLGVKYNRVNSVKK